MVEGAPTRGVTQKRFVGRLPRPRAFSRALSRDQRGTAVVEFALVGPILFLLVFGVLDFGRLLNYYNQQTQLVGQGARAAAVNRNPDGTAPSMKSIQTQIAESYANGELNKNVTICIFEPQGVGIGLPVTVTATYTFKFLPLISLAVRAASVDITASQTMRQEALPSYTTSATSGASVCAS